MSANAVENSSSNGNRLEGRTFRIVTVEVKTITRIFKTSKCFLTTLLFGKPPRIRPLGFVCHAFISPPRTNVCVTNEPQRTSAGTLEFVPIVITSHNCNFKGKDTKEIRPD